MFNNPAIREATLDDVTLLASIIRRSFEDVAVELGLTPENTPTHPAFITNERVESAMNDGVRFFLLEVEGEATGSVALEKSKKSPGVFYLERLAVLPKCRERGAGSLLINYAVEEARALGASRVEIGTIAEQTELQQWYEKRGFVVKGRRKFSHLPFEVTFMAMEV